MMHGDGYDTLRVILVNPPENEESNIRDQEKPEEPLLPEEEDTLSVHESDGTILIHLRGRITPKWIADKGIYLLGALIIAGAPWLHYTVLLGIVLLAAAIIVVTN